MNFQYKRSHTAALILLQFLFVSGILLCERIAAQNYRNTITGFVFTPDRSPISQIPVEVTNEVGQILQRTRTDGTGRYFFTGLSAGRFSIRVLPYGTDFEEQVGEVEIINFVRPGSQTSDNAHKDFYLRSRRRPDSKSVTGTLFAQEIPTEAKKLYQKAVDDLVQNRTDVGIEGLLKALKIFPDYYLALDRLGAEYVRKQNFDYARAVFIKTVSVNDRSFTGWYGLSYSAYALKQPIIAVEAAEKATVLEPSSDDAFVMLGIAQRQGKKYFDAEKSLLRAKKIAGNALPNVHWNLALLYANNLNKYEKAADELELYLRVAPSNTKIDEVKKLIAKFRKKAQNAG